MAAVLRRLGWGALVIAAATTVSFFVIEVVPGDPARLMLGPQASAADVARVRHEFAFDSSVPVRFTAFVSRLVHVHKPSASAPAPGDHTDCVEALALPTWLSVGENGERRTLHFSFGKSSYYRRPVMRLLSDRAGRTLALSVSALLLEVVLGTAFALFAARRPGGTTDSIVSACSTIVTSVPLLLVGLLLQFVLGYRLRLLPVDGFGKTTAEQVRALVLPSLTLAVASAAIYFPVARSEIVHALGQDHARFARAKGASRLEVLLRHGLRNATAPIISQLALDLGAFLSGAVVVETLFRIPGIGQLAVDAMLNRDGPLVLGCTVFSAASIVGATLIGDLTTALLDPRVRR